MNLSTTNAPFQPLRGNTIGELQLTIASFETRLRRAAQVLAEGETALAEDLYQAAITQLWEHDPSRFDLEDDGYLWQSMINRMLMARRADGGNPTRPPLALRFP